jgi:hypothetical protein
MAAKLYATPLLSLSGSEEGSALIKVVSVVDSLRLKLFV